MYYCPTQKRFNLYYDRLLMKSFEEHCDDLLFSLKQGEFYAESQQERFNEFVNISRNHRMAACLYICQHAPYRSELMLWARQTLAMDLNCISRHGEMIAPFFLRHVFEAMSHRPSIRLEFSNMAASGHNSWQGRMCRFINGCMLKLS
jgi:hypothetical protein